MTKAKSMVDEEVNVRKMVIASLMSMSDKAKGKAPPWLLSAAQKAAPLLSWMIVICRTALPYMIQAGQFAYTFYSKIHPNLLKAIFGFITCFFGGFYPTLIAAYEGFAQTGWEDTVQAIQDIGGEINKVLIESDKDDKKDDDNDGKADVDQLSPHELLLRKSALALKEVDAAKFNKAMSGLYTSTIAVAAVLKVQFARTIALAVAIGDSITPVATKVMTPVLDSITPQEYHQWIPILIGYMCKSFAMAIAWYIQMVLSAFHSAIRGGLMCTRGLMKYAHNQGWDLGVELNHEETMLDEYAGWALAAVGFLFQISFNFHLPFPFNVVLFPLTLTENFIRWRITLM